MHMDRKKKTTDGQNVCHWLVSVLAKKNLAKCIYKHEAHLHC